MIDSLNAAIFVLTAPTSNLVQKYISHNSTEYQGIFYFLT